MEDLERLENMEEESEIRDILIREYERRGLTTPLRKNLWKWGRVEHVVIARPFLREQHHFYRLSDEEFQWIYLFSDLFTRLSYDEGLSNPEVHFVYRNYGEITNLPLREINPKLLFCDVLEAYYNRPDIKFDPGILEESIYLLNTFRSSEEKIINIFQPTDPRSTDPRYLIALASRIVGNEGHAGIKLIDFFLWLTPYSTGWLEEMLLGVFLHYFKII